ncbi:hypothetical protein VTK26DRAFT_2918 [Humicola hyalothermophila]
MLTPAWLKWKRQARGHAPSGTCVNLQRLSVCASNGVTGSAFEPQATVQQLPHESAIVRNPTVVAFSPPQRSTLRGPNEQPKPDQARPDRGGAWQSVAKPAQHYRHRSRGVVILRQSKNPSVGCRKARRRKTGNRRVQRRHSNSPFPLPPCPPKSSSPSPFWRPRRPTPFS